MHPKVLNVEGLFGGSNFYRIPPYQRPYSWTKNQVADLWEDLVSNDGNPFLGVFVLNDEYLSKDGVYEVIDGQQRILSLTILFSALRNYCNDQIAQDARFPGLAAHINQFVVQKSFSKGDERFRITPATSTSKALRFVQDQRSKLEERPKYLKEDRAIKANYDYLYQQISEFLHKATDQLAAAEDLFRKIASIEVISITIGGELDAQDLFERMNDRGMELSAADLVKNLIFRNIDQDQKDAAFTVWDDISENLKSTGRIDLQRLVRYYWLATKEACTKRELFKNIKKAATSNEWDYSAFLQELKETSRLIRISTGGLVDEFEGFSTWKPKEKRRIEWAFRFFSQAGIVQVQTILYILLKNFVRIEQAGPKDYFKNFVRLLENFSFKYSLVCSLPTNKLEDLYSEFAIRLNGVCMNVDEKHFVGELNRVFANFQDRLHKLEPSWSEFAEKFADFEYDPKLTELIQYVLIRFNEDDYSGETFDYSDVNIEHIFPQNPAGFTDEQRDELKEYINRIGNLIPLNETLNRKAGNKGVSEKLEVYAKSRLKAVEELVSVLKENGCQWGRKQIDERTKQLARLAHEKVMKIK